MLNSRFSLVISFTYSGPISNSSHPYYMKPLAAAAAAVLLQSSLTLCDPIDGSPLGSSVSGILQARILEWVAISFSNMKPLRLTKNIYIFGHAA